MEKSTKKEKVKEESIWDRRKIALFLVGLIIVLACLIEVKNIFLGDKKSAPVKSQSVISSQTSASENLPDVKKTIQDQISSLRKEASNINVVDIASSSPQVQKIIKDLQGLKDLPRNEARQTCEKICSGL